MDRTRLTPPRLAPVLALGLLAFGAAHALWRAPSAHEPPGFLADQGVVVACWLAVAVAALGAARRLPGVTAAAAAVVPGAFVGASLAGRVLFPASLGAVWGSLLLGAALWLLTFARVLLAHRAAVLGALAGVAVGAAHVHARLPAPAATHPALTALDDGVTDAAPQATFACGSARLEVAALLAFTATSRDGFWPGLSLADVLEGEPALGGAARRARLVVTDAGVEATVSVPHDVASHLNRFTDLRLLGAQAPRLGFDDLGQVFELTTFDYPTGRPAHFAFARGGTLTVARGHDAEKGPFTQLAQGPLPDGVLRLTFFDGARALCGVEFDDFLAQADVTNDSPTAGEGVAPNVIQFGIPGKGPALPMVHLSLAETGIGAGRDTVLHAAGVYRNRVRVVPR
jgi:hypothetical protein